MMSIDSSTSQLRRRLKEQVNRLSISSDITSNDKYIEEDGMLRAMLRNLPVPPQYVEDDDDDGVGSLEALMRSLPKPPTAIASGGGAMSSPHLPVWPPDDKRKKQPVNVSPVMLSSLPNLHDSIGGEKRKRGSRRHSSTRLTLDSELGSEITTVLGSPMSSRRNTDEVTLTQQHRDQLTRRISTTDSISSCDTLDEKSKREEWWQTTALAQAGGSSNSDGSNATGQQSSGGKVPTTHYQISIPSELPFTNQLPVVRRITNTSGSLEAVDICDIQEALQARYPHVLATCRKRPNNHNGSRMQLPTLLLLPNQHNKKIKTNMPFVISSRHKLSSAASDVSIRTVDIEAMAARYLPHVHAMLPSSAVGEDVASSEDNGELTDASSVTLLDSNQHSKSGRSHRPSSLSLGNNNADVTTGIRTPQQLRASGSISNLRTSYQSSPTIRPVSKRRSEVEALINQANAVLNSNSGIHTGGDVTPESPLTPISAPTHSRGGRPLRYRPPRASFPLTAPPSISTSRRATADAVNGKRSASMSPKPYAAAVLPATGLRTPTTVSLAAALNRQQHKLEPARTSQCSNGSQEVLASLRAVNSELTPRNVTSTTSNSNLRVSASAGSMSKIPIISNSSLRNNSTKLKGTLTRVPTGAQGLKKRPQVQKIFDMDDEFLTLRPVHTPDLVPQTFDPSLVERAMTPMLKTSLNHKNSGCVQYSNLSEMIQSVTVEEDPSQLSPSVTGDLLTPTKTMIDSPTNPASPLVGSFNKPLADHPPVQSHLSPFSSPEMPPSNSMKRSQDSDDMVTSRRTSLGSRIIRATFLSRHTPLKSSKTPTPAVSSIPMPPPVSSSTARQQRPQTASARLGLSNIPKLRKAKSLWMLKSSK